ncbi:MAG: B12-binding domain-containing radical SAM protein [Thermodesulfobacteriota bacterium]
MTEPHGTQMKIALLTSPYPLAEGPSPPLGLCYAAAAFEAAGADVRIFDYMVRAWSPEKMAAELSGFGPDVIGTNSVTLNFNAAANLLKTAKQLFPETVTIMGGPHVSFDYENTLRRFPQIDLIVVGEGEQTIAELVPVIKDRKAWAAVAGIAFMENGAVRFTGSRELIHDLDRLPLPARHLLPMSRYLAMGFPISIITSRGCPGKCIFCQGRRMVGSRVRNRDARRVMDEIESLLAFGFDRINFADDFFTSNARRVREVCAEIERRSLNFCWTVFARADSVTPDMLAMMRHAGCDTIFFGFESGNQEMLDRIGKTITLDRIRRAVADSKAAGMRVFGSFIAGLPGETAQTLADSDRFARELDVDYGYHFLVPFPGTDVKERIADFDLELLADNWDDFDANRSIVRTSALSPQDIEQFVEEYYSKAVRKDEERIERDFYKGTLSEAEQLRYMGKQNMEIVFDLLTKDLVEKAPAFAPGNGTPPVKALARHLAGVLNKPLDFVQLSVTQLSDRGYLRCEENAGHAVWRWR